MCGIVENSCSKGGKMTMYDTADKLREESKDLFKGGLSFRQLWWIVKLCKAV